MNGEGFFENNLDERVEYVLKSRGTKLRQALVVDILKHELASCAEFIDEAVVKVKR